MISQKFDAERFCKMVEKYRVTATSVVPTMTNMILNHPNFHLYDLSSLKNFMNGGSPFSSSLYQLAQQKLPNARLYQGIFFYFFLLFNNTILQGME